MAYCGPGAGPHKFKLGETGVGDRGEGGQIPVSLKWNPSSHPSHSLGRDIHHHSWASSVSKLVASNPARGSFSPLGDRTLLVLKIQKRGRYRQRFIAELGAFDGIII